MQYEFNISFKISNKMSAIYNKWIILKSYMRNRTDKQNKFPNAQCLFDYDINLFYAKLCF